MNPILAEHAQAQSLTQADLDAFAEQGVPALALLRSWAGDFAAVSRERVVFDGDRFEFERHLLENIKEVEPFGAFTVAAFDRFGDPIDIVAFRADRVATWLGRADMLGGEQAFFPRIDDVALDVHETVLGWLQAGRRGVVILNPTRAAHDLRLAGTLRVPSRERKRALGIALTTPPPRIVVRDGPAERSIA